MTTIVSVEFHSADTMVRKGFIQAFHSMVKQMLRQKRKGDSVKIHFADGSVHDYVIDDAAIGTNHDTWAIKVSPGIV